MSYSRRAYTDMSGILRDQVQSLLEEAMTEDELSICMETVRLIAEDMADLFEADNPKGFDRKRFMSDSGANTKTD